MTQHIPGWAEAAGGLAGIVTNEAAFYLASDKESTEPLRPGGMPALRLSHAGWCPHDYLFYRQGN